MEKMQFLQKELDFYVEQFSQLVSQLQLLTTPNTAKRVQQLLIFAPQCQQVHAEMIELGICDEFWPAAERLAQKSRQLRLDVYALVPFVIRVDSDEINARLLQTMAENLYKCCANILQFKGRFGVNLAVQKSQVREVVKSPGVGLRKSQGDFLGQSAVQPKDSLADSKAEFLSQIEFRRSFLNSEGQKKGEIQQKKVDVQQKKQEAQQKNSEIQQTKSEPFQQQIDHKTDHKDQKIVLEAKMNILENELNLVKTRVKNLESAENSMQNLLNRTSAAEIVQNLNPAKRQEILLLLK